MRIAVMGGNGGAGASTFAAVLAWAAQRFSPAGASLIDLDGAGGGIDVLLGVERVPGPRWSDLRLDGGRLEAGLLLAGLPHWCGVPVLAADRSPPERGVPGVLEAAGQAGLVVLNLARTPGPAREAALVGCDLVVVLVCARVPALAAARVVLSGLPAPRAAAEPAGPSKARVRPEPSAPAPAVGVLVRSGDVPAAEVAVLLGRPVLGCLRAGRPVELAAGRPPRALVRAAAGLLDGALATGP